MSGHLDILAKLLKKNVGSHKKIAKAMGWGSPSAVGNKLRGERAIKTGELAEMAKLAGITLVQLAAMSDDLVLAEHPESVQAATLLDGWPEDKRKLALEMLAAIAPRGESSQS